MVLLCCHRRFGLQQTKSLKGFQCFQGCYSSSQAKILGQEYMKCTQANKTADSQDCTGDFKM